MSRDGVPDDRIWEQHGPFRPAAAEVNVLLHPSSQAVKSQICTVVQGHSSALVTGIKSGNYTVDLVIFRKTTRGGR